jgi:hypothetical protein
MTGDVHLQVLVKGEQRYVVMWTEGREKEARSAVGDWAGSNELDFNWYDAVKLSKGIRRIEEQARIAKRFED